MGASGSAQRNLHQSAGTGSQRSMNMRSSSISSGAQSIPEIGYLEEETSEVDNSNTVFIQNHGSVGNNGMQIHGSSNGYGIQNHGSSAIQNHGSSGSFGMQNHGSSVVQNQGSSGSYGMQNHGSSGSIGMQNHGSSSSVGIQNHGSSGSGISGMNYQSVGYY